MIFVFSHLYKEGNTYPDKCANFVATSHISFVRRDFVRNRNVLPCFRILSFPMVILVQSSHVFCYVVFSLLFIYTGLILLSRVSSIPLPTLLSTNQFFLNASMFYIESKFVIEFSVIFYNSAYFLSIVFLSILVTPRF